MNIKKAIRLSFTLIVLLIIILSTINWAVVKQIKNNHVSNNKIHELVSFQSKMAFILSDSIKSHTIEELNLLVENFHQQEKAFEKTKDFLISRGNSNSSFVNRFMKDIKQNTIVKDNLEQLYKNEKVLEEAFEEVVIQQRNKFLLQKKFERDYPTENNIRKNFENTVIEQKNLTLLKSFGNIKYFSKETLFQHKNKKYLNKWLDEIEQLKGYFPKEQLTNYKAIVSTLGNYILQIEKIYQIESSLEKNIQLLLEENQKLNASTIKTIESLSSDFIQKINLLSIIIALLTITVIIVLSIKVYQHVGLSVDDIEHKVQDGLLEVNKLNKEIENTQKEVVFTMGAIGESRSKETGNHVKRVAEYSKLLALYYGLSEQQAEMLKQASPMHDIGKVAIPDAILNKPGRFNEEEYQVMKTHAELGHKMLDKSQRPLLKMASIVAYEHHEKWDGTGYPQGTSGENIHIYGRITALADVFDALGSDRVYKKAWDDQSIFDLFKKERGHHFDPQLVDIFFQHLDEFLKIRSQFRDV